MTVEATGTTLDPPAAVRRAAELVAHAGCVLSAAGALALGVMFGQLLIARRNIPGAQGPPPRCQGHYGDEFAGAVPLRVALVGDSTAAGYGVRDPAQTPGALLAAGIARATRRPVRLTCPAVVGSVSAWLGPQVETAEAARADLAIIMIGANDVTTRAGRAAAVVHLTAAVRTLRSRGAATVVATCPDLGTVRAIRPPLRWLARYRSRRLAAAQAVAAVAAGGRTVSLGHLLGPRFAAAPDRLFAQDGYHPSAEGYREAAAVVLPTALAALGIGLGGQADAAGRAGATGPASKAEDFAVPSKPESPDREPGTGQARKDGQQTPESR